jgi:uncharacterized protein YbjQ (UPF0145 family)
MIGVAMKRKYKLVALVIISSLLVSCASSIVESEGIRTNSTAVSSTASDVPITVYFADKQPTQAYKEVGRVTARAWLLDKGIEAAKQEAKKLGANAIVNVKYERRFSADYLQDLYFINGIAVVLKTGVDKQ